MAIVIGFDIHREQVTFDALDDVTGEVRRGRIARTADTRNPLPRRVGRRGLRHGLNDVGDLLTSPVSLDVEVLSLDSRPTEAVVLNRPDVSGVDRRIHSGFGSSQRPAVSGFSARLRCERVVREKQSRVVVPAAVHAG
jgi:hypothetical protein